MNAYRPVEIRLGIETGRMTRISVFALEQPSISAASSRSIGTVSKKLLIIKVQSGMTNVVYASTREMCVSSICICCMIIYRGTRRRTPGIICDSIIMKFEAFTR